MMRVDLLIKVMIRTELQINDENGSSDKSNDQNGASNQ